MRCPARTTDQSGKWTEVTPTPTALTRLLPPRAQRHPRMRRAQCRFERVFDV